MWARVTSTLRTLARLLHKMASMEDFATVLHHTIRSPTDVQPIAIYTTGAKRGSERGGWAIAVCGVIPDGDIPRSSDFSCGRHGLAGGVQPKYISRIGCWGREWKPEAGLAARLPKPSTGEGPCAAIRIASIWAWGRRGAELRVHSLIHSLIQKSRQGLNPK